MPRNNFQSIPTLPDTGHDGLNRALEAMKQNIELLCGMRGSGETAIIKNFVSTAYPAAVTGTTATDIANLRETLRSLMTDLKE